MNLLQKKIYKLSFYIVLVFLFIQSSNAQSNRIQLLSGESIFSSGMNMAWGSFARDATNLNEDIFIQALDEISDAGGNTMRWWLHVDGRYSPQYNCDTVSSITQTEINNVKRILDLAYERKMRVCISLWSHDMLKGEAGEMITIRNQHMLADSAATVAYINNALIPMVYALKGHPGILCWEIINEPEGMISGLGWTGNYPNGGWTTYDNIKRFTNLTAGAIHRTDPDAQVTTGTHRITYLATNYSDSALIASGGDPTGTLDFYQAHYYTDFTAEQNPFAHGTSYYDLDKPIVIGEFPANLAEKKPEQFPNPELPYQMLFGGGYAGAWTWTWTGHDGNGDVTDAQPGMTWLLNTVPNIILVGNPGIIKSFSADTSVIAAGDSVMLMWETTDSSDVILNGISVDQNDSIYVKPLADSTYKLVASSPFYADSSELVIQVLFPGSIHYFTATPSNIALGESSLIQWHVIDSARVTLNNDSVSSLGSMVITPSNDTTLTLRSYGTVQDSASITISVLDELAFNRALNKPAYSSSIETEQGIIHYPGLAVDGNPGTRWSTEYSDPQWIYVDLLGFYDIKRVVCNWEAAYGDDYMIQVSDNAAEWTTIHAATDSGGGIDDIRDLSGIGRFVRMLGLSRGPNNWGYSLWELEVYGYPQEDIIVTEYTDNFNDGILTGWKSEHPRTFGLSETDGVLTINYTRTDSSEQWDNFNFTPIGKVDASSNPYINVRIKSTIPAQVTFKPIYESGDDWLQKNLPGDTLWHYYTFNLTGLSSTPISIIYMYLDGGQPNLVTSGIVQFDDFTIGIMPVLIDNPDINFPMTYSLGNAYPNPFNPSTTIRFSVVKSEKVKLIIYDVLGRKVKTLFNDIAQSGVNIVKWHGENDNNIKMSSGIYFYRLETESGFVKVKKMVLVK